MRGVGGAPIARRDGDEIAEVDAAILVDITAHDLCCGQLHELARPEP